MTAERKRERIGFVGAGRVGSALALGLAGRGYTVVAVASRRPGPARRLARAIPGCRAYRDAQRIADAADLVFIATPDEAIASVAQQLRWRRGQTVVHCSGALSLDVLEPARSQGARVGGFHPLQSFPGHGQRAALPRGSLFALEGAALVLTSLRRLARDLGGDSLVVSSQDKPLYHLGAVLVSNYTVTLFHSAVELWQRIGIPKRKAESGLLALLGGTVSNIQRMGVPRCLTGPIARGDIATVRRHLQALRSHGPALLGLYQALGLATVPVARAQGSLTEARAKELIGILTQSPTDNHLQSTPARELQFM